MAHDTGKLLLYYADHKAVQLPDKHRFPMDKYQQTRINLQNDPSLQQCLTLLPAPAAEMSEICAVHDSGYVDRFQQGTLRSDEMRGIGFPWSVELVSRTFASAGGTVAATRHVLQQQGSLMSGNVAGGTHHAFADR